MKLLVIGIDGGTAAIFDRFDMPFWQQLRGRDVTFDMTEDLNQRGWARMLSGQGAEATGGLYMRPRMDGTRRFDFSYNYAAMAQAPGFVPVWQLAERTGARVGMMNVPTTSPAQDVAGFYVSGGGGGLNQGGLPDDAVFPRSARATLEDEDYIFDTRLGAEGFTDADTLARHIEVMMERRARTFTRLAQSEQIDFGFVAFRATTVLFFLAMSEIARMLQAPGAPGPAWSDGWGGRIARHMTVLDDTLARMFDALQPDHHIVVSDHSMVPWTHNVDFNGFLAEAGFASFASSPRQLARNVVRAARRPAFRRQLAQTPLRQAPAVLGRAGGGLSGAPRAFGGTYVYGIYVNDADRFGGPVAASEVTEETDRIVAAFNWTALRRGLAMRARPYRRTFGAAPAQAVLPDVTIDQDGHAFPSNLGPAWYGQNPNFAPVTSVRGVGGMHSGQKGCHPVLMADPALAALAGDAPPDLRLVHALTGSLFGAAS